MTATHDPAQPVATHEGAPVYPAGDAPAHLLTTSQLRAQRRRVAAEQTPAAWLSLVMPHRGTCRVPLYDPAGSIELPPLSPARQRAVTERRTCAACSTLHSRVLRGGRVASLGTWARWCEPCLDADRDRHRRTCGRCATLFEQHDSVSNGLCLACHECRDRARPVVQALTDRACPRCTIATATAEEVAAARAAEQARVGYPWWVPRTCEPCQAEEIAEREAARLHDRWQRWDEVGPVRDWARELLADPDGCVLDCETTGRHPTARIVEIAVYTTRGEKILDQLINPGVPIPADATAIHKITDADVADAPKLGEVLPALTKALAGRRITTYNLAFDSERLAYELDRWHRRMTPLLLPLPDDARHPAAAEWIAAQRWDRCAMQEYAVHFGDWNPERGSYNWQKLRGGHRAGGDCLALLERLKEVADTPDPA